MQHAQRLTLVEMREFVASSGSLNFIGAERKKIYSLVERTPHTQLRFPPLPHLEHPRKGDPHPAPASRPDQPHFKIILGSANASRPAQRAAGRRRTEPTVPEVPDRPPGV